MPDITFSEETLIRPMLVIGGSILYNYVPIWPMYNMLPPITNMGYSFSDESLLYAPVPVTVGSLTYTPHTSYSGESLLHAPR